VQGWPTSGPNFEKFWWAKKETYYGQFNKAKRQNNNIFVEKMV
jgi:hypothetical protein